MSASLSKDESGVAFPLGKGVKNGEWPVVKSQVPLPHNARGSDRSRDWCSFKNLADSCYDAVCEIRKSNGHSTVV